MMFGRLKAGVKKLADNLKQQAADQNELSKWQAKFRSAKSSYGNSTSEMDEREALYLGTSEVDANVNSTSNQPRQKANNVYNILYEAIETQVDTAIPQPIVRSKSSQNEQLAKIIEDSEKSDLLELNIERLNDVQERTCPIQGYSLFEIYWDMSKRTHMYIGDIGIRLIHPKQFIPCPGVWDIQKMPYFFILSSVTKDYIKKRYDVDVTNEGEEYPNINTVASESNGYVDSENVTEIVCWYKDDDGDVGRFVWCNDTILENLPKFLYRKRDGKNLENFTLQEDYGNIPAGTQLPYFVPDRYPVVMRVNVPFSAAGNFGGQSDIDTVRDQQDALKKVGSKIEKKILKGGSIIMLPASQQAKYKPTDDELQILWAQPNEINSLQNFTMQPDITKDLQFFNQQKEIAKDTLGITAALQGLPDSSARSGTAKQLQIAQSTGRLKSKQSNKIQAYKELFEIIFQFKLAYMDEARPYITKDASGNPLYSEFNRLDFLKQDSAGEWYYDTDFIFTADGNGGLPSDRTWQLNETIQLLQYGAFGQVQSPNTLALFWQVLEGIHFPNATQVKNAFEGMASQQQQMQQAMQAQQMVQGAQTGGNGQMLQGLSQQASQGQQTNTGGMQ